jgi:hypothetical protein
MDYRSQRDEATEPNFLRNRVTVGAVYIGLIVVLGLLTAATFVPDPASLL